MDKTISVWVIAGVALVTFVVTVWQGDRMLEWYPVPVQGFAGRIVLATAFTVAAAIFGLVAGNVYTRLLANRPESASQLYLGIGLGAALLLTVAAVVVNLILKRGPVLAWIILNFLWGLAYGWLLPALMIH